MTAEHRAISNALLEATLGIGTHGLPVSTDEPAVVDICPHRRRRHGSEPCYFDEDGQCWSSGEDGFPGACPGRRARTPRARPAQVYDNFSCCMTFNGMEIPLGGISLNDATFAQQDRETDQEFRTRLQHSLAQRAAMPGTREHLIQGIMGLRFGGNEMAPLGVQIEGGADGSTVVRVAVEDDVNHHDVEERVSEWLRLNNPVPVCWVVMAEYPNPNTGEAPFANLATATGEDLDRLAEMHGLERREGTRGAGVQRLRERRQRAEETRWYGDGEEGVPYHSFARQAEDMEIVGAIEYGGQIVPVTRQRDQYCRWILNDGLNEQRWREVQLDSVAPLHGDRRYPHLFEDPRTGAMVPRSQWAEVMAQDIDEQEEGEY